MLYPDQWDTGGWMNDASLIFLFRFLYYGCKNIALHKGTLGESGERTRTLLRGYFLKEDKIAWKAALLHSDLLLYLIESCVMTFWKSDM